MLGSTSNTSTNGIFSSMFSYISSRTSFRNYGGSLSRMSRSSNMTCDAGTCQPKRATVIVVIMTAIQGEQHCVVNRNKSERSTHTNKTIWRKMWEEGWKKNDESVASVAEVNELVPSAVEG